MPSGIYKRTEETIEKNRISHLDKIPWNKGKTGIYSEKTLEKMRKGRNSQRTEFKKGHIAWNKGKRRSKKVREEISKANKGKHLSINTEFKKGIKHPCWQGGISFEPYSPEFNKQLKELIRQRDGYKCQLCGMPEIENIKKLDIHHIDYIKGNCLPNNLITLCSSCNGKVNFNRDYWEEYFKEMILEKVE